MVADEAIKHVVLLMMENHSLASSSANAPFCI